MPLTALQVKNAAPRAKEYELSDGDGLALRVRPCGSKAWRFRFSLDGRQQHVSLGSLTAVTLAQARKLATDARQLVAQGQHPGAERQAAKAQAAIERASTFMALALEWHAHKSATWSPGYAADVLEGLKMDVFPHVGSRPLASIEPLEWLEVFRRIEARGALEKLRKVRSRCAEVYRFAIVTGRARHNPVADIGTALQSPKSEHYPHLPVSELPALLAAIRASDGSELVKLAAQLLILTGVRTSELRCAPWAEFDLAAGLWQIPAERMKMRRPHMVPLPRQALALLEQVRQLTGGYTLAFPGRTDPARPMSEAAVNQLLKRCGYHGRATGHGFRHTLSTALHEEGYPSEWVETQLAHVDKNSIRGTYNHASYLDGRRKMLQWYADHLDAMAKGGNVVAGSFGRRA